ncbi:hypothetical protein ACTWLT_06915 [Micromonospora sp. ZYX-F-536]|uniref:hypothetical protein n=1 Tax=Micromonospora sp. ZYX-F-536 TaxID=3457629 RepID=UPI004040AAE8
MDVWVTLVAAVAGAAIAILGQYLTKRGEANVRLTELLLEQCSRLVALAEDFRHRVWEERELGLVGRVDGWDLGESRLAQAKVRILCGDQRVLAALEELNSSGKSLGAYWRRGQVEPAELEARYERVKRAIESFTAASATLVRRRFARAAD